MYVSVVGASRCGRKTQEIAYLLGREVARRGHVLVCGGLTGVMDAAARGAHEEGGVSIGILPGPDRSEASRWLTISVVTDMGHARNALVALSGDAMIAVGGGFGTLSEIAFGMKMGKPVVGLGTWGPPGGGQSGRWCVEASDPAEAMRLAEEMIGSGPGRNDQDDGKS